MFLLFLLSWTMEVVTSCDCSVCMQATNKLIASDHAAERQLLALVSKNMNSE